LFHFLSLKISKIISREIEIFYIKENTFYMEKIKVYDKETFVKKARTIHDDKFNYDLFEYTGSIKTLYK